MAFLHEAGTASSAGMGVCGLSWTELSHWKDLTFVSVTPFEIGLIKDMSDSYANEYSRSDGTNVSAPYSPITREDIERNREIVSNKVEALMNSFMNVNEEEDSVDID